MEAFLKDHPFDRSVFIMIRYRKNTEALIGAAKTALLEKSLVGICCF